MNTRPRLTSTRTFVRLEVTDEAYTEVRRKLMDAGYTHCFPDGPTGPIDMHGIALVRETDPHAPEPRFALNEGDVP